MIKNARLGASANPTSGACRPVVLCHSGCPAWSNTGTNVSKTSPARDAAEETRPRKNARRQRKGSIRELPLPVMFATGWRVPVDHTRPDTVWGHLHDTLNAASGMLMSSGWSAHEADSPHTPPSTG